MRAHAFPPGTICILLHFKVPLLPLRKETSGVKEFTSQASKAAGLSGFMCYQGVLGCRGAAVGWRVHPWGRRWKRATPSFVPSSFLVSWLGAVVVDCDPCVRLCKMQAFTFYKEG